MWYAAYLIKSALYKVADPIDAPKEPMPIPAPEPAPPDVGAKDKLKRTVPSPIELPRYPAKEDTSGSRARIGGAISGRV